MKIVLVVGSVLLLNLGISCQKAKDAETSAADAPEVPKAQTYQVYTEEGIEHILNTGLIWGDNSKVKLESLPTIGGADSTDKDLTFYKPTDIALDSTGNLYVLDAGNHRIQKIGPNGTLLASLGRRGQGPGEFQFMEGITIDEAGNLYVTDKAINAVKVLAPDGNELRLFSPEGKPGKLELLSSGEMVFVKNGQKSTALLVAFNEQGDMTAEFGRQEDHDDFDRYRFFNRIVFTRNNNDQIYVAYGTRNRIEKYDPSGELILSIERPLNFPISQEIKYEDKMFGPRKIKIPFVNFVSAGMALDGQGRIWVLTYNRQLQFEEMGFSIHFADEEGRYEGSETLKSSEDSKLNAFVFHLFNAEGHLLTKIPIDHHAGTVRIFQDRLYILETRHEMCVYTYRIVEK